MRLALVLYILLVIGGYDFGKPNALFMDTAAFPDEDDDDDK
jgi:hypothetical protein